MWHDRLGRPGQAAVGTAKAYYNDRLTDPSLGWVGIAAATALNSGIDIVGGFAQLPRMLGHLGEGTECFWDHPSWETFPALMQDVGVVAAVASVGAAGLGGSAEGAAAAGTDAGSAEVATEGAECGSGPGCFVAGTPVRLADGSAKPVEAIRPGDWVQSRDPETGVAAAKRVVRAFIHTVDHTVVLTLPSGEEIETTEVHPFYVEGKGFIEAGKLGIGTSIVTRAGPTLAIARIARRPGRVQVYNFEVEGFHTYFVGQGGGGVWVHNAGLCDPEPGPGPFRAIAERIGRGHAYLKHVVEEEQFDLNEEEFVDHVERVMEGAEGGNVKPLSFGRTAYYDDETGTVVIHNPDEAVDPDLGTAFRAPKAKFRGLD